MSAIHDASFAELDAATVYGLLRLRVDVFVVEQDCAYPELDGRDTEATTRHVWTADDHGPSAYLRVLSEGNGVARVGRVCTRLDARGAGLAAELMHHAVDRTAGAIELHAQSYLVGWYARFDFTVVGDEFLDDGIPHTPMRRAPQTDRSG